MKLNNHNTIHPQTSVQESDTPIDAEIIAEVEFDPSQVDQTEEMINLTAYPCREDQEEHNESSDSLPQWLKQMLIPLSTPWGLGALCLVLGTNLTIVGVQLWKMYQTPEPQTSTKINPDSSSLSLSIPKSLNIARQSPNTVILDALSTTATPKPSQPSPKKFVKASPRPQTPTVINVNQPPSLTNAIFPPSLQPQTPVTALNVPQTPQNRTAPPPSIPVANIPRPVPAMTIAPPPPPNPLSNRVHLQQQQQQKIQEKQNPATNLIEIPAVVQDSLSQDEQVRQTIKQQLHMEENNQNNVPLGFNDKTRLELQNGVNEVSPELLPQQTKYLEQLKERQVLDTNQ